jgi:hypothetical protein
MSDLYNITKLVLLSFDGATATATGTISVQFPVKQIMVRQVSYQDDQTYTGLNTTGTLHSDLVKNQCLAIINMSNTLYQTHASGGNGVRFCYKNPIAINGQYNFQIRNLSGEPFDLVDAGNHQIALLIEFIGMNGVITDVSV